MLDNFGVTCTFEFFITVGLLFAIPVSAGTFDSESPHPPLVSRFRSKGVNGLYILSALDIYLYGATFYEMRLAGIVTVSIGFCVVLLPENWPDYITRCIRFVLSSSSSSGI